MTEYGKNIKSVRGPLFEPKATPNMKKALHFMRHCPFKRTLNAEMNNKRCTPAGELTWPAFKPLHHPMYGDLKQ